MIDLESLSAALEPTRKGLDAAGFDFAVARHEDRIRLTVSARPDACEDCLVPKSLFRQMAADEINDAGLTPVELEILYPIDARRKQS
jgi:hypothetical protein